MPQTRRELEEALRLAQSQRSVALADASQADARVERQRMRIREAEAQIELLEQLREESPAKVLRIEKSIERIEAELEGLDAMRAAAAKPIGRRMVERMAVGALASADAKRQERGRNLIVALNAGGDVKGLWVAFADLREVK